MSPSNEALLLSKVEQKGVLGQALNSTSSPLLFSKISIRHLEFPNRVFVSPMCMYSAQDGFATDFHLVHIGQFALRGYGLIMMESTAVAPEGRISPNDLGLWNDDHIAPLKRITQFVHSFNGRIGIQLNHAGRKASTYPPSFSKRGWIPLKEGGWEVIGPSASLPFSSHHGVPKQINDIPAIKEAFLKAVHRAVQAGFDVIELHAAHGYLLHQFLSPLTNQRQDEYGGNLKNRANLLLELVQWIRYTYPTLILFVRLSCTDWMNESTWDMPEVLKVIEWIQPYVDVIDCSSGMLHPNQQCPDQVPGFQVPFAHQIKVHCSIPTIAVGNITDPLQAEEILQLKKADFVMLARALLRDSWLYQASKALSTPICFAVQYERGQEEWATSKERMKP